MTDVNRPDVMAIARKAERASSGRHIPLLVEYGYDAVSMQEVAEAVPLNKATHYHHFQNKVDLSLAVVRTFMTRLYGQIQGSIAQGGSAADQLTWVGVQVFEDSQAAFGRLRTDARLHLSPE